MRSATSCVFYILPANSRGPGPLGPVWPEHAALASARTLDLRGWLRAEALKLPVYLDTLRTYEYYAHSPGPLARKTLLWGPPYCPPARRLVLFSTLEQCTHVKYRPQIPRYYPPGVKEVVLNLRLPGRGGEWGRLDVPPKGPELDPVTVVLTPSSHSHQCSSEKMLDGVPLASDSVDDKTAHRAFTDLAAVLDRLAAPTTLVGWEHLDQRLVKRDVLAPLEEQGVELRRADVVRKIIGEHEWGILTREAPLPSEAWTVPQAW
ncbi:uncharacterized protein COLE_01427 [Cutaneotrichosporon oleaginosum]|uniref:uncharacterized protein n=1 Tax=Cutaneotrichosporon oleaginosum TaxID=879819 RepID=UPI001322890D|nr:hypothetical protein COLE_01427 [Cutaneotrichosporon oleaginosum]